MVLEFRSGGLEVVSMSVKKNVPCEFNARTRFSRLVVQRRAVVRQSPKPDQVEKWIDCGVGQCNLEPGQVSLPILWLSRCLARALFPGSNTSMSAVYRSIIGLALAARLEAPIATSV